MNINGAFFNCSFSLFYDGQKEKFLEQLLELVFLEVGEEISFQKSATSLKRRCDVIGSEKRKMISSDGRVDVVESEKGKIDTLRRSV
jgi:hypothetical protein